MSDKDSYRTNKETEMNTETDGDLTTIPATLSPAARDALTTALASAKSPATRRAYRTAWKAFEDFAADHGAPMLPAAPETVAAYLASRKADGGGMPTLRMACAAIAAAHDLTGHANPCTDRLVKTAMKGFGRQAAEAGQSARQAQALTAEAVAAIRGAINGKTDSSIRAARDMAMVSVLAEAGLRRSEAAALTWADVTAEADGSGRVLIRRGKTDQEGEGATVAITAAAMTDLERLAAMRGRDPAASVFDLSDRQIARRVAAMAKLAGLGEGFSGHSGRVGMAVRMTRNGAPAAAVMRQGRWETTRMVSRYTRNETAAEALRYL